MRSTSTRGERIQNTEIWGLDASRFLCRVLTQSVLSGRKCCHRWQKAVDRHDAWASPDQISQCVVCLFQHVAGSSRSKNPELRGPDPSRLFDSQCQWSTRSQSKLGCSKCRPLHLGLQYSWDRQTVAAAAAAAICFETCAYYCLAQSPSGRTRGCLAAPWANII